MTIVRDLITRAGRITHEVGEGNPALEAYGADVALTAFNAMMADMRGVQLGQRLSRVWDAAAGDTALAGGIYNCAVYTPAQSLNGDRFRVLGARTVTATDDTIEGASSVTTTVATSWMYREDQGNWQKEADLALTDESPLQAECDESLAVLTAARMYGETFGEMPQALAVMAVSARNRIRQLYQARAFVSVDNALLRGLAQRRFG